MLISILEILPCTVDRPHPCNSFFAGLDTSGICKATTPLHHKGFIKTARKQFFFMPMACTKDRQCLHL